MGKVHILPPEVISKIAAGEVIERPASVVKELLENALDANADSVELHLKDSGKTLIRLKDNGTGIEPDDLEKIFLRHTTSKIRSFDDLFSIRSLGFRGEALYTIGAVSDVTLRSRTQNQDTGWEIHWRGGEKLSLKPAVMERGTEVEIQELFFNTPARKKFLKGNTTELNQILNIFLPYTLACEGCSFSLSHQGKDLVDLKATRNRLGRIASSLHLEEKHLIEVRQDFPEEEIALHLILGDINIQRTRRDLQFIFVNDRPVQNRNLGFHMNQVYRLLFPEGVYPFFALYLSIPPSEVDVNTHPTKREVKIKDENRVALMLRSLTEKALMNRGGPKEVFLTSQGHSEKFETQYAFQPAPIAPPLSPEGSRTLQQENLQNKLSLTRYIGSFLKKYLLFETGHSLFIVDQHAAQERIMYEAFRRQIEGGRVEVQPLLTPIVMRLSIAEMLSWEEAGERLKTIGLETTQWDKESIALHTHPQLIKNPELALRELLSGGNVASCDHDTIARRACRASITAGDSLTPRQAEYQRDELLACADPFTCPHGRPTVIEVTEGFLDKQFLRS